MPPGILLLRSARLAIDGFEMEGGSANGVEKRGVVEEAGAGESKGGSERTALLFVKYRPDAGGPARGPLARTTRRRQRLQSIMKFTYSNGEARVEV